MEITYIDIFILTTGAIFSLILYGKKTYGHFKDKGVKFIEPSVPYFGSFLDVHRRKEHMTDILIRYYRTYPNEKYIGLFDGTKPLILARDLNVIKQIGIKNFDSFADHKVIIDESVDDLFGRCLMSFTGEKWKDMRSTLSPAFTISKMKNMFDFIQECAIDMTEYYVKELQGKENDILKIEAKDAFTKYTNDVIANSIFGIRINSIKDQDNEFYNITKATTSLSGMKIIKFTFFSFFPAIMKMLKIEFLEPKIKQYYRNLMSYTMKMREENSIIRKDMLHLLMEAKKGKLKHETNVETVDTGFATVEESALGKGEVKRKWTDDDLVAQVFIFLLGGFDTTSNLIVFLLYEVLRNPEIQKKLQLEIDEYGNKIEYGDLQKLKYLDCCISETLRLWPPVVGMDRVCTKTFTLPPPNDSSKSYTMQKDDPVWIPTYAIHVDPNNFPDPYTFNPDRFSEENKSSINMDAYMPFGIGPRNCIGSRFALIVGKVIVYHILREFDIVATDKTEIPLEIYKGAFNFVAKDGVHIGLKKRVA